MLLHLIYCQTRVFEPGITLAANYILIVYFTLQLHQVYKQVPQLLPQHALHAGICFFYCLSCPLPSLKSFHILPFTQDPFSSKKMILESAHLRVPSDTSAAKPYHFNLNSCKQGIKLKYKQ